MPAPRLLLALMMLCPLLLGCAQKQRVAVAAAPVPQAATSPDARKAAINRALAPRCPTPGQVTPDNLDKVATDLEKGMPPHWQSIASEYDRMDDESTTCRTGLIAK